jgi:RNA polymerase sigma-70 factor (ECF subfamily)
MSASTLILTPNLEQGESSHASRIAAGMKRRVLDRRDFSTQESDNQETNSSTFERQSVIGYTEEEYVGYDTAECEQYAHPSNVPLEHLPTAGPRSGWSDVELVQAFQHGDERAFAELYTRRKREIYTFCVRMLGGDRDLANDAFQETFIKVYEKGQSFRSGANVMGWLFMIARNTCLNLHRAKRPSETLDDQPMLVSSDRSLAPEYGEEQHYLRELLEQAIALLPEDFREPFILREFDGFSYGEIAKMTGVSLPTIKVRIYRAKQRLRELLKPFLDSEDSDTAGAQELHSITALSGDTIVDDNIDVRAEAEVTYTPLRVEVAR